jgi:hypothetical protein
VCDCRRGIDWWMDLLTTYAHNSELQVITALSLISTIHRSPQHSLSLSLACCVLTNRSLAMASNSGDSSASCSQVLSSHLPVQNSCQLSLLSLSCRVQRTRFPNSLLYNSSVRTTQKTPLSKSKSIVACVFVTVDMCLPSRCSETFIYSPIA